MDRSLSVIILRKVLSEEQRESCRDQIDRPTKYDTDRPLRRIQRDIILYPSDTHLKGDELTSILPTQCLELPVGCYLLGKRPVTGEVMGMELYDHILMGPQVPHGDVDGDVRGIKLWFFIFDPYTELTGFCQDLSFDRDSYVVVCEARVQLRHGCKGAQGEFADFRKIRDVHMFQGVFGGVVVGCGGIFPQVACRVVIVDE